ncbi:glycosyltransferase family 2 protein [Pseudomonadota bacterium]|nr:glycosyltransferase family 2 protein [Pseudomonadota bacterium]
MDNKSKFEQIYIVVPAFNEASVIADTLKKIEPFFKNIVVVNDGSSDETSKILQDCNVFTINHAINLGVGAAIKTGFDYIISNCNDAFAVITFDADGQHNIEDAVVIANELINSEKDVVFGSRFLGFQKNIPIIKRYVLQLVAKITTKISKVSLSDAHNGLKGIKISAIKKINIEINSYAYESELIMQIAKHNLQYMEVPTNVIYSEYSLQKGQKLLNGLIILEDLLSFWNKKK